MNGKEELLCRLIEDESFILWVYTNEGTKWPEWMAANPRDRDVLEQARRMVLSMTFKSETLAKERIEYIKNTIEDNIILMENPPTSQKWIWSPWIKKAAVFFLLISGIMAVYFILNSTVSRVSQEVAVRSIEKSTHAGQKLTTNLPDGSKITMNSHSKISYDFPFRSGERVVRLDGEAFFEVVKDSLRPFNVISGGVTTTVLGTSFNINCRSNERVKVSLVSGKVVVTNESKQQIVLNPGEKALANRSGEIELSEFTYLQEVAWKDGILAFSNASLPEIIEKLEEWYGIELLLDAELNTPIHYTGKYKNESLEEVLQGISFVYHFDYKILEDTVKIYFEKKDMPMKY